MNYKDFKNCAVAQLTENIKNSYFGIEYHKKNIEELSSDLEIVKSESAKKQIKFSIDRSFRKIKEINENLPKWKEDLEKLNSFNF